MFHKTKDLVSQSLKELHSVLKANKAALFILLFFQILTISIASYIIIIASITLTTDLQNLTTPLEAMNLEDPSISEQEILLQGAKMYAAYEELSKNLTKYIVMLALLFFTLPGISWSLSHIVVQKTKHSSARTAWSKERVKKFFQILFQNYLRYLQITATLFLPYAIIMYVTGSFLLSADIIIFTNAMQLFFVLGIVLILLWLFLLSQPLQTSLKHFFHSLNTTVSWEKLSLFYLTAVLIALPIAASLYALQYTTVINEQFTLMLIAAFFFFSFLVLARLLLILNCKQLFWGNI